MTKPHEENWKYSPNHGLVLCDGRPRLSPALADEEGAEEQDARLQFASAAPDMARALLKILRTERDDSGRLCVQSDDEGALVAALAKAGVPLPLTAPGDEEGAESGAGEYTGVADALKAVTREEMERRVAELRSARPSTPVFQDAGPEWTIRDEYAARAMQTLLALDVRPPAGGSAAQAFAIADEMMAARGAIPAQVEAMRSACVAAALRVFDQPGGGFTRDQLRDAIARVEP